MLDLEEEESDLRRFSGGRGSDFEAEEGLFEEEVVAREEVEVGLRGEDLGSELRLEEGLDFGGEEGFRELGLASGLEGSGRRDDEGLGASLEWLEETFSWLLELVSAIPAILFCISSIWFLQSS